MRAAFAEASVVHDAESPDLVGLGDEGRVPLRVNPALVETDLVVTVTAAETVLNGGPAALLGASGPDTLRHAGSDSLLETAASPGWRLAVALERAVSARVPLIGASLALNNPPLAGAAHGYPYERESLERLARLPGRRLFSALPGALRATCAAARPARADGHRRVCRPAVGRPRRGAPAGRRDSRSAVLDRPLDALCLGIPRATSTSRAKQPNPLLAAALGLGLALRLWRDAFPVADGGTAILVHPFRRRFPHPTQAPYRAFFGALRTGVREPGELAEAERGVASDARAVTAYRDGRACHPLAAVRRLGRLRACARPARSRVRCGVPRRDRGPPARLRPDTRDRSGPCDGRGARSGATCGSASCSRRRTSRSG